MLYDAYEVQRSLLAGASRLAGLGAGWLNNPANPFAYFGGGPIIVRAGKPIFNALEDFGTYPGESDALLARWPAALRAELGR